VKNTAFTVLPIAAHFFYELSRFFEFLLFTHIFTSNVYKKRRQGISWILRRPVSQSITIMGLPLPSPQPTAVRQPSRRTHGLNYQKLQHYNLVLPNLLGAKPLTQDIGDLQR
jgi:hypothetical protein